MLWPGSFLSMTSKKMSIFFLQTCHTSIDSPFIDPRGRKINGPGQYESWSYQNYVQRDLNKLSIWWQRVAALPRQGEIDKIIIREIPWKKTPWADFLWTLPCPRPLHPANRSKAQWRFHELSKKEFTASFPKKLQDKQNKHQLVSAGHPLACLVEGDARDSFLRLLPDLHF